MLKNTNEFPDLHQNIFKNISLQYFKDGLDPSENLNLSASFVGHLNAPIYINTINILYALMYKLSVPSNIDANEYRDSIIYIKDTLYDLHQKNKISQVSLHTLALSIINRELDFNIFKFMVEAKLINVNFTFKDGSSFLFFAKNRYDIKNLIKLGCDFNIKITSHDSIYFNCTAYEAALQLKKKSWINNLQYYMPTEIIKNNENNRLAEFRNEVDVKNQLKLFLASLRENNLVIINEIERNQDVYDELIKYRDNKDKNLMHHAISKNNQEVLYKLRKFDYYSKNKEELNNKKECYTSYAVLNDKTIIARDLFFNEFKNDKSTEEVVMSYNKNKGSANLFNDMVKFGYKSNVTANFMNGEKENLLAEILLMSVTDIDTFFRKCDFFLNFVSVYTNIYTMEFKKENNEKIKISKEDEQYLYAVLKRQSEIDFPAFNHSFLMLIQSLNKDIEYGYHNSKMIQKIIQIFPDMKNSILDNLQNVDWVIELKKNNLELELSRKDVTSKKIKI